MACGWQLCTSGSIQVYAPANYSKWVIVIRSHHWLKTIIIVFHLVLVGESRLEILWLQHEHEHRVDRGIKVFYFFVFLGPYICCWNIMWWEWVGRSCMLTYTYVIFVMNLSTKVNDLRTSEFLKAHSRERNKALTWFESISMTARTLPRRRW